MKSVIKEYVTFQIFPKWLTEVYQVWYNFYRGQRKVAPRKGAINMMNTNELIKMVEGYREEYRDYMEQEKEANNTEKMLRHQGAIEGFTAILNELRDMQ